MEPSALGMPTQGANVAPTGHHAPMPLLPLTSYSLVHGTAMSSSPALKVRLLYKSPTTPQHQRRRACLLLPAVAERRVVVERRLQLLGLGHLAHSLRCDTWQRVSERQGTCSSCAALTPHCVCSVTKFLVRVQRNSPPS